MPVVSVVVIGFNDAQHLPAAIRSATRQTLRDIEIIVVDDGSTDDTAAVTARLAAADHRLSVVRLTENSGGCSRPRNVGMSHASGDYVTFLDSDDVLPRRACARLVAAAQSTDADMVVGRWLRRHHSPTRFITANDHLYRRPAVIDGILDRPAQLYDTPACAKLYRRTFLLEQGLQFPEGLLYEDLLFTTEAYCTARRIAVVPDLVYVWNVRHDAVTPSITNRRDDRRWRDRFEIHRRIDAFLAEHAASATLRTAKDVKFLEVDFALFLRELRLRPAAERAGLLDVARGYVEGLDLGRCGAAPAASRVGAHFAARGDLDQVLRAADFAATGQVGGELVRQGARLVWSGGGDTAGSEDPDVTDTGLGDADFSRTPFRTVVREAAWAGDGLRVAGTVADVLGRLDAAGTLRGRLLVTGRVGGELWSTSAALTPSVGGIAFTGHVDLDALGRSLGRPTVGSELRLVLELRSDRERARLSLTARDARLPSEAHPLRTRWRLLVGDRVRIVESNGRLVLQLAALPAAIETAIGAASWLRYTIRRSVPGVESP